MPRIRSLTLAAAGALLLATATLPAQSERKLQLSFRDGTVTLVAANVTVREILAEWARLGGSRVINGEKLAGGPLTLQFENESERVVIDSLLRSAAGYVLGPRLASAPGASQFGVISILPTSQSVAGPVNASPSPAPIRTGPDDEIPPVRAPIGTLDPRQPANPPVGTNPPAETQPNRPPVGVPGSGVVPIVPVTPTPPPTTPPSPPGGRGRGGGGGAP